MKKSTIFIIAIAFIACTAAAFLIGRRLPQADLQSEIAGLKTLAISQEQTTRRMDSTILALQPLIKEFVIGFDQFRIDNKLQLQQMERQAAKGREFQQTQIKKLADLNKRRDELAGEAAKFEY